MADPQAIYIVAVFYALIIFIYHIFENKGIQNFQLGSL